MRLEGLEQIEHFELHALAHRGRDAPLPAFMMEMARQHLDRQTAQDLELAVEAFFGALDHLGVDVGRDEIDRPPRELRGRLDDHRKRIGFLPARRGTAPNSQPRLVFPRCQQSRQHHVAELIERHFVAEERCFVRRHRIGDRAGQRFIRIPQLADKVDGRLEPQSQCDRLESALDQIGLFRGDRKSGPPTKKIGEKGVIRRVQHRRSAAATRAVLA